MLRAIELSPVEGAVSDSEKERALLQQRLSLLGMVGCLYCFAYYVIKLTTITLVGRVSPVEAALQADNIRTLLNMASAGLVWLICSGDRRHPLGLLKILDVYIVMFYSTAIAVAVWLSSLGPLHLLLESILITYGVLARAAVVPSTASRTAWVSALAYLPIIAVASMTWGADLQAVTEFRPSLIRFVLRGVFGIVLAAIVSKIIYGLRSEVTKLESRVRYILQEEIGRGGMGQVFRGQHAILKRPLAIKRIKSDLVDEDYRKRFQREAQLASQLTHPSTVTIHDYGQDQDGNPYIVMEYLDGKTLDLIGRGHPQDPGRVIHILRQLCGSLAEAHGSHLIHRDVKPSNVILCVRGDVYDVAKLVDFGLVKDTAPAGRTPANETFTEEDGLYGTPVYIAPESCNSADNTDVRSDLYAVGAVGYFLLTGYPTFDSIGVSAIAAQLTRDPVRPSERLSRRVPADLETLIMRCLARAPDQRPQTAAELDEALSRCEDSRRWTQADAREWWLRTSLRSERQGVDYNKTTQLLGPTQLLPPD